MLATGMENGIEANYVQLETMMFGKAGPVPVANQTHPYW
jgi:hypothetical protein